MIIKDTQGKYEVKVNTNRNIVYEKLIGLFKDEDMERYHEEFKNKIAPALKGQKWTKCTDLREYKTSSITETGKKHLEWCKKNGMVPGAIIVSSAVVKMQMNRIAREDKLAPTAFTDEKEADAWLKEQGF
ncbi:hypothetical protein [Thermohalobacter berrensis]|uniref:STAS/SEC14 domain-containing protein n=1 Tax=Thermohalobacter berrensis TaxID=99594 RepID=A0A419TB25_9FIRM|nr:hypothetical protein [Thermohalobacter berrensis]RKD34670.1 hypothetical protein BET03_02255 [Thermohalobacter berrensis]